MPQLDSFSYFCIFSFIIILLVILIISLYIFINKPLQIELNSKTSKRHLNWGNSKKIIKNILSK